MIGLAKNLGNLRQFICRNFGTDPSRAFLIIAFSFGMLMIFTTPPLQGPDESAHFLRTVQISNLDFTVDQRGSEFGGELNSAYGTFVKTVFDDTGLAFHPEKNISPGLIKKSNGIELEGNESKFLIFGNTAVTPPLAYFPAAIGAKVGSAIGFGPLGIFYLARIFSFLSWLIMTYFAIKTIPIHKIALATINLIPMVMFQAGMITADAMVFGLLSLLVATVLRLRSKKESLSRIDWITISTIIFALALTKPLMFIFSPLIFLSGNNLGKKSRIYQLLISVSTIPLSQFWGIWTESRLGSRVFESTISDSDAQKDFLINNPQTIVRLIYNTYFSAESDRIFKEIFGVFGWVDTPLPLWVIGISFLVVISSFYTKSILESKKVEVTLLSIYEKSLVILIAIGYFLGVNLALYVYFAPPELPAFFGVQGRYFIPLVIMSILLAIRSKQKLSFNSLSQTQLFLASSSILTLSVFVIAARYY